MGPGIYGDISNDTYQSGPGISTSFRKEFANSPRKAWLGEHKSTPALEAGTLIHTAILEPALLDTLYKPTDARPNTKQWELEARLSLGRILIKREE